MEQPRSVRILAVIPLGYSEESGFWNRDVGLVIRKLRAMGHDAWLVALRDARHEPHPHSPVLVASKEELENAAWWRAQRPDAIILNAWSAPRWHGIRSAVASLGIPLIEQLDTDGVKSSRIWLRNALQQNWSKFMLTDSLWKKGASVLYGVAKTMLVYLVPSAMDTRMVRSMSHVPVYAAETPVAAERVRRFLRMYHASPMPRVVTIPHPTNTDTMGYESTDVKENLLIAVGRWKVAKKGWLMLLATAKKFLPLRRDWKLMVIGSEPVLTPAMRRDVDAFQGRLTITGPMDHARLSATYRRSKVYIFPSYWETFNIAAAEALCCGCTVVGPAQLASAVHFASFQSGTPSYVRSPDHLTDALLAEIDEWENGRRDPAAISRQALELFSAETVAKRFLEIFRHWSSFAPAANVPDLTAGRADA